MKVGVLRRSAPRQSVPSRFSVRNIFAHVTEFHEVAAPGPSRHTAFFCDWTTHPTRRDKSRSHDHPRIVRMENQSSAWNHLVVAGRVQPLVQMRMVWGASSIWKHEFREAQTSTHKQPPMSFWRNRRLKILGPRNHIFCSLSSPRPSDFGSLTLPTRGGFAGFNNA